MSDRGQLSRKLAVCHQLPHKNPVKNTATTQENSPFIKIFHRIFRWIFLSVTDVKISRKQILLKVSDWQAYGF